VSVTAPERTSPIGPAQVILQLAGFEGRRLFGSVVLWLATAASIAVTWLAIRGNPNVLNWQSVAVAGSCLPIAAVAFLLAHGAARRDRSFEVDELTEVPPTDVNQRMLGLSIAGWAPVILALGVIVFGIVFSLLGDPAGSPNVAELVVGPSVVVLSHVSGVALGRWAPHPLVAPLALVFVASMFLVADLIPGARTIPAASPFLPWRKPYTDWVQGEPREPLAHLLYLTALIGALSGLASRSYRTIAGSAVVVVATVVFLSGIPVGGEEVSSAVEQWGASQPRTCEDHDGIKVCAIDGYEPWFDDWFETLDALERLVPTQLRVREVQQTTHGPFDDRDTTVAHIGGNWVGPSSTEAGDLTIQVLAPELGLPGTRAEAAEMNTQMPPCMAQVLPLPVSGQARAVALMVLSELAAPGSVQPNHFGGPVWFGHVEVSEEEARLALQIAQRRRDEVLTVLHANWTPLTEPSTTTETLAGWFGLEPPETLLTSSYEGMTCVCLPDGGVSCSSNEASGR